MHSLSQRSKQNGAAECHHNRHEGSGQTKPTEREAEKYGGACQKNQQSASPAMAEQQWYRLRPGHSVSGSGFARRQSFSHDEIKEELSYRSSRRSALSVQRLRFTVRWRL